MGPLGTIVMVINATKAVKLREAYEDLMSQVEKLKQDNQEQENLISYVNQLVTKFDEIDDKMINAITAMKELSKLFGEQAACYDKIALYLGGLKTAADAKGLAIRKTFIDYNLGKALEKLKSVCDPLLLHPIHQKDIGADEEIFPLYSLKKWRRNSHEV